TTAEQLCTDILQAVDGASSRRTQPNDLLLWLCSARNRSELTRDKASTSSFALLLHDGLLNHGVLGGNRCGCWGNVISGHKDRLNICRDALQSSQCSFHRQQNHAQFIQHLLGPGIIAFRYYREEIAIEVAD